MGEIQYKMQGKSDSLFFLIRKKTPRLDMKINDNKVQHAPKTMSQNLCFMLAPTGIQGVFNQEVIPPESYRCG